MNNTCSAAILAAAVVVVAPTSLADVSVPGDMHVRLGEFLNSHPGTSIYEEIDGRIARVYGQAFSYGGSTEASAEAFRVDWAEIWGVDPADLIPVGPFEDGRHVQPILYQPESDSYRFTGHYYTQLHDGLEVFRSRLCLLVRNEAGHPLVLAAADLHALGDFVIDERLKKIDDAAVAARATQLGGPGAEMSDVEQVVWAGVDQMIVEPRVATTFIVDNSGPAGPHRMLYVIDAANGDVLFQENQILHVADLEGTAVGSATQDVGADVCEPEDIEALPYLRIQAGGDTVYADAAGNFIIPDAGDNPIQVDAELRGQWFNVNNNGGPDASISLLVDPDTETADFHFNEANADQFERAEVNAYYHANIVRDFALSHNPAYPTIANQENWPVNVNQSSNCNAFYNGSSINFFTSGGGCSNTAFSVIVHHEYGHHMVNVGGSGQGAYGEGMSDCMGVLITDTSKLAVGFYSSDCNDGIRDADNTCQYLQSGCSTCGSAIHSCGQLISGCIWDTRWAMEALVPGFGREITANLCVNSILLHSGTSITPAITIDFMVLDDNDGNLNNGTPHYEAIQAGFSAHGMPGPTITPVSWTFPTGIPEVVPGPGSTLRVAIGGVADNPIPGSARIHIDSGNGFEELTMTEVGDNVYDAALPGGTCGEEFYYYFTVDGESGSEHRAPTMAPTYAIPALVAEAAADVFSDHFETNTGWTTTAEGGLTAGDWVRAEPDGGSAPDLDADGSGRAYITGLGEDVDNGTAVLTSPTLDASFGNEHLHYWTWFSNADGPNGQSDTMTVEVSDDNGATWTTVEQIGPTGTQVFGGWFRKHVDLSTVPDFDPGEAFRVRFRVSDTGGDSTVEAAVDGVELRRLTCGGCEADVDGNGIVDVTDLLGLISEFGPCQLTCPYDLNGDGSVSVGDLLLLLGQWGPC